MNTLRPRRGQAGAFDFLGFTHICAKTRAGESTVLCQTMRKRLRTKLSEVKSELRRRMHDPVPEQGAYLHSVVKGHCQYYGVPLNGPALKRSGMPSAGSGVAVCGGAVNATA